MIAWMCYNTLYQPGDVAVIFIERGAGTPQGAIEALHDRYGHLTAATLRQYPPKRIQLERVP